MENATENDDVQSLLGKRSYLDYGMIEPNDMGAADLPEKGGAANPFPFKLHHMLDLAQNAGLSHVVSWQPHGRCFVIHDEAEFTEQIMPMIFPKTKFASFKRQLNMYGFSRLMSPGKDYGGFYHELFLRGKSFLCRYLHRTKIKGTGMRKTGNPKTEPDLYSFPPISTSATSDNATSETCVQMKALEEQSSNANSLVPNIPQATGSASHAMMQIARIWNEGGIPLAPAPVPSCQQTTPGARLDNIKRSLALHLGKTAIPVKQSSTAMAQHEARMDESSATVPQSTIHVESSQMSQTLEDDLKGFWSVPGSRLAYSTANFLSRTSSSDANKVETSVLWKHFKPQYPKSDAFVPIAPRVTAPEYHAPMHNVQNEEGRSHPQVQAASFTDAPSSHSLVSVEQPSTLTTHAEAQLYKHGAEPEATSVAERPHEPQDDHEDCSSRPDTMPSCKEATETRVLNSVPSNDAEQEFDAMFIALLANEDNML